MRNITLRALRRSHSIAQVIWQHPKFQLYMRWFLTVVALSYITWSLWHEAIWREALTTTWPTSVWWSLGIALALLPLNLFLEVKKWHTLIRSSFPGFRQKTAWAGVIAGSATGIFTPNRIGDYAGRLMFLPRSQHVFAAIYTFVSRIAQMGATLLLGCIALVSLVIHEGQISWAGTYQPWLLGLTITFTTGATLAFLFPQLGLRWLHALPWKKGVVGQAIEAITELSPNTIRKVWGLAVIRGAVFIAQFAVLMLGWIPDASFLEASVLVSMVLLLKSVVPSVALAELGVRESVALLIMGAVGWAATPIVMGTFSLYLINLILPALLGLVWLIRKPERH